MVPLQRLRFTFSSLQRHLVSARSMAEGAPADEALEAAFNAELAEFFVALREGESSQMLQHLGALRAMSSAESSGDVVVWKELHGACARQAHEWVQQRVQQLVASFHVHLHEERGDLLFVDRALQEGGCLLCEAQPELGDLQVSHEVLTGCERQLLALLQAHVRRANRHELRVLYADFCHEGRAELRQLCLEKHAPPAEGVVLLVPPLASLTLWARRARPLATLSIRDEQTFRSGPSRMLWRGRAARPKSPPGVCLASLCCSGVHVPCRRAKRRPGRADA